MKNWRSMVLVWLVAILGLWLGSSRLPAETGPDRLWRCLRDQIPSEPTLAATGAPTPQNPPEARGEYLPTSFAVAQRYNATPLSHPPETRGPPESEPAPSGSPGPRAKNAGGPGVLDHRVRPGPNCAAAEADLKKGILQQPLTSIAFH